VRACACGGHTETPRLRLSSLLGSAGAIGHTAKPQSASHTLSRACAGDCSTVPKVAGDASTVNFWTLLRDAGALKPTPHDPLCVAVAPPAHVGPDGVTPLPSRYDLIANVVHQVGACLMCVGGCACLVCVWGGGCCVEVLAPPLRRHPSNAAPTLPPHQPHCHRARLASRRGLLLIRSPSTAPWRRPGTRCR
jgi:hypothetical protein